MRWKKEKFQYGKGLGRIRSGVKSLLQKYCKPIRSHPGAIFRPDGVTLCRPDKISHPDDIDTECVCPSKEVKNEL